MGRADYKLVSRGGLAWLECAKLRRLGWLLHAFSLRQGGRSRAPSSGLNLGFTEWDRRARVNRNRQLFFAQLGAKSFELASLRQIHSSHVYFVARGADGKPECRPGGIPLLKRQDGALPAGDALLTDQPGILLSVRSADCMPVLLVDAQHRAVAAIHAGWRGALARIIEKAVGEMRRLFGSEPQRLLAALGPSIRVCCYEVGREVVEAFHGGFVQAEKFFPRTRDLRPALTRPAPLSFPRAQPSGAVTCEVATAHLDLVAVASAQLRSAGVLPRNISAAPFCTACRTDLFFSHRREGRRTGRLMAVIGIRPGASR